MSNEYGTSEDTAHRTERLFAVGDEVRVQGRDEKWRVQRISGKYYGLVEKERYDEAKDVNRPHLFTTIAVREDQVYQLGEA